MNKQIIITAIIGMLVGVVFTVAGVGIRLYFSKMDKEQPVVTQQDKKAPSVRENIPPVQLSNFEHFDVGKSRNVKSMLADGDVLWVGTSGGLVKYDTISKKHEEFNSKTSPLLSNGIFFLDKFDNKLWVGTYGGGLSVYDGKEWKNYNIPYGLADPFVYGILKATNGDIWIATWSGANQIIGGHIDDTSAWRTYTVENTNGGLPNDWVYGMDVDSKGVIWLGTEGGLARYDGKTWQNWNHEKGLGAPYEKVKDSIIKSQDSSSDQSKHHAKQRVEMGLENIEVPFNPNYIVSMLVDAKDRIWVGTWGGGLSMFENGKFTTYTTEDGLLGNYLSMLKEEADGTIWAGSDRGLSKLVEGPNGKISFANYTTLDGLYSKYTFSMVFTKDKSAWVGSFGGLTHFIGGMPQPMHQLAKPLIR